MPRYVAGVEAVAGPTWLRRPELLENLALTEEQAKLLAEFKTEHAQQQHEHDGNA